MKIEFCSLLQHSTIGEVLRWSDEIASGVIKDAVQRHVAMIASERLCSSTEQTVLTKTPSSFAPYSITVFVWPPKTNPNNDNIESKELSTCFYLLVF